MRSGNKEWELEDKTLDWIENLNEIKCNSVRGNMWPFRKRSQVGSAVGGLVFTVMSVGQ